MLLQWDAVSQDWRCKEREVAKNGCGCGHFCASALANYTMYFLRVPNLLAKVEKTFWCTGDKHNFWRQINIPQWGLNINYYSGLLFAMNCNRIAQRHRNWIILENAENNNRERERGALVCSDLLITIRMTVNLFATNLCCRKRTSSSRLMGS